MMYLSRLTLNPRNAQVRSELARPYEMHRTLLNAFPAGQVGVERQQEDAAGVLFRVDTQPRENRFIVLVQSRAAPDWGALNTRRDGRGQPYLLAPAETKTFELQLKAGQRLAFRLRANPTKRLGNHARDANGKRVGILDEAGQMEWLQRKSEAAGARILQATVSRDSALEDTIHRDDQEHALKLISVQFDGVLLVVDPVRTYETVQTGIGSGKGLGFGLLSLAAA